MTEQNFKQLWNRCLNRFRDNVSDQAFRTWFLPIIPLKYESKALTVLVPNVFFYEYLEDKYLDLIQKTLYEIFGKGIKLNYKIKQEKTVRPQVTNEPSRKSKEAASTQIVPKVEVFESYLKSDYTFDNYIEGLSNKLARNVGFSIAENPAKTFNPLFIYGSSGVGKTHLINAIGLKIKELHPQLRVLYVSAHLFQIQYTDSVRHNTFNDFMNFYQKVDVLILDDIQEFAGVSGTQNTFFHIFNHLHQNGKQLILASDRAPVQMQGIEDRLITRFKWGMVTELETPTVEMRKNILRNKMRRDGVKFPEEVVNYIADNVSESVRDLEGIVISLLAHSTLLGKEVDLELAKLIVRKVAHVENKEITIDTIINVVCKYYHIDEKTFHSTSRKQEVVQARQVAMWFAKNNTTLSISKIGTRIGGKNHATVVHSCKIIEGLREVNKEFNKELMFLQEEIKKASH
ncbi:MAG: chromosomal replication initiator protein DnaA [Bacteroidales bacterium]|nr:chromosomal replication initiator protein DnaA [Bacteroidales bacterium]